MFLCSTCSLSACFDSYLGCIHLVFFLLLQNSSLGSSTDSSIPPRYLLDTSLIQAFSIEISGFLLDTSIDSLIRWAKFFGVFVCSIPSWYLPRCIKNFCYRYLLDTSRFIEILFLVVARYLLDLSSCVFFIYFWGSTRLCIFSNISISLNSLSTQKPSSHQNPSSYQVFGLILV